MLRSPGHAPYPPFPRPRRSTHPPLPLPRTVPPRRCSTRASSRPRHRCPSLGVGKTRRFPFRRFLRSTAPELRGFRGALFMRRERHETKPRGWGGGTRVCCARTVLDSVDARRLGYGVDVPNVSATSQNPGFNWSSELFKGCRHL